MISISTTESNTNGNIIFKSYFNSNLKSNTARVARNSTLDGSVVINHLGVVDGDRTFIINTYLDEAESDRLWSIFNTTKFILLSTEEGLFYSVIQTIQLKDGKAKLTILVHSKET